MTDIPAGRGRGDPKLRRCRASLPLVCLRVTQTPPGMFPGGVRGRGQAAAVDYQAMTARGPNYLTVTEAPAPSRAALAFSAASLLTFSRTVFGAPSTRSLASLRPRLV